MRKAHLANYPVVLLALAAATVLADDRIWTGGGVNALASNPTNWANTNAPVTGDGVVLDDRTSKNMTWNLDVPVQSWTQIGYTGTVTIATIYGANGFTNLAILGDCVISNGAWTQTANPDVNYETNRLRVTIGGDLIVGSNAVIDVSGKGYARRKGPGAPNGSSGGSHGGRGGRYDPVPGPCYGSVTSPTNLGSGGGNTAGGGAVWLTVGGTFHHEGQALANGQPISSYHTGAGGSIYVVAGALSGTGAIRANGGISGQGQGPGGGGRIALVVTNDGADFSAFTGPCETLGRATFGGSAAGTIYLEKQADSPGKGELIVKGTGTAINYDYRTDLNGIDAVSYEFSRITLTNAGVLGLLTNNTLILTNTELRADPASTAEGIAIAGGTLVAPAAYAFSNFFINIAAPNSTFSPASRLTVETNGVFVIDQPHAMACAITLERGGVLTHTANSGTEAYKINLTLDGSLTVNEGGLVDVTGKGYAAGQGPGRPIVHTGSGGGSHGGRGYPYGTTVSGPCYGSVTGPTNLGSGGSSSAGGGAIRLTVTETLTNDGQILANGQTSGSHAGAGGSVWITAGDLVGNGPIRAMGGDFTSTAGAGGGGRIALTVTNAGATLDSYAGTNNAYGGRKGTGSPQGGAGTVYLRAAGQGQAEGVLIVDNDSVSNTRFTEISSNVTDAAVGDVLIRNGGCLLLLTNQSLTLSGIWSNGASFTGLTDSMVSFAGGAGSTSTLFGSTTFMGLVCTNAGKTLLFQADATNSVSELGRLWLRGSDSATVKLRSTAASTAWKLNVDATADQAIEFVDVQDSDASDGTEVTALNSVNSDRNSNWRFLTTFPGQTITWTGGSNTAWAARGNWNLDRAPIATDSITIPSGLTRYPALDADRTVNCLAIESGASLALNGWNLTVTNVLTMAGALIASGTETVTLLKDADFTGGMVDPLRSTVILAGGVEQAVNLGGATFFKVRVDNSAAPVNFAGGFSATELRCEAPGGTRTLRFEPGKTVRLRDLVLRGAVWATNMTLNSTSPGSMWNLAVTGYRSVRGVSVRDSDARPGLPIPALDSEDRGENPNWQFGVAPTVWLGTSGNNFHTPENWSPAGVPIAGTRVLVEGANPMVITGEVSILDLVVGGGADAASVTVNGALTVGESVVVFDQGVLTWNRPGVVSNDFVVAAGGLLTHSANGTTEANKIDLTVLGDVDIEIGGKVDVLGKGYQSAAGPGGSTKAGNGSGGSYGGKGGVYITDYTKPCYGSIVAPTNCGSGGGNTAGGGAILMSVEGSLRVDGVMAADGLKPASYYAGSGGTISLRAETLHGVGMIRAKGGDYTSTTSPGGGGRIALVLTGLGADLDAFTGTMHARGGLANGAGAPLAGAGTIYLQTGADRPGRGQVMIENGNATAGVTTDVPSYTNDVPGEADRAVFHVANGARLRLLDDFVVGDIWLDTANATLDLGGNTLFVNACEHSLAPGTVVTNNGAIVWRGLPPGALIIVK